MLKLKIECHGWTKGVLNLKNEGYTLKRLINWILIGIMCHTINALSMLFQCSYNTIVCKE